MDEKLISMLIGGVGAGGTVVSGIFVWWLKGAIGDLRKITLLVKNFENLKASIDSMSGKLDAMNTMIHQNNKEIAVLEEMWRPNGKDMTMFLNTFETRAYEFL